jgi:hypothetical protein
VNEGSPSRRVDRLRRHRVKQVQRIAHPLLGRLRRRPFRDAKLRRLKRPDPSSIAARHRFSAVKLARVV